jgi:hypothetical protein
MKYLNMACSNFGDRGGTNLQSRLLMGCIGSLASGPGHSSHRRDVTSPSSLLLRITAAMDG